MSEMEYHVGKLKKLDYLDGKDKNEQMKEICRRERVFIEPELKEDLDERGAWDDIFYEEDLCEKYVICNGTVYEIIEHEEMSELGSRIEYNDNDTIKFYLSFYNGGGGFNDCLEDLVNDYEKKQV